MRFHQWLLAMLTVGILLVSPIVACLWDKDTLDQERQRFPSTLELITGQFLRHSQPFYEWRVEDRAAKLKVLPNKVELYDDLAVAYEKLGKHDEALATMDSKDKIESGLYETAANRGTFLIHAGRLDEGLKEIERAIEINPDAHFGREIYQKLLVEYVLDSQIDGKTMLPLDGNLRDDFQPGGYAAYVLAAAKLDVQDRERRDEVIEEIDRALKGVRGMMRFGNYDSPVLLEALADLLLARGYPDDGKRLAVRAFLKASYETEGTDASAAYRKLAGAAIDMQTVKPKGSTQLRLETLEKKFKSELAEGAKWFKRLENREKGWIKKGKDPEAEYEKAYYKEPVVGEINPPEPKRKATGLGFLIPGFLLGIPIAIVLAMIVFRGRSAAEMGSKTAAGDAKSKV